MKNFIKVIKSIFTKSTKTTINSVETLYCNDPIVIEDINRKIQHKEAFFNLYLRCSCESGSCFPVYLANMIRHCRLHMFSLPVEERQSFFNFCLAHKVDISHESLVIANNKEKECFMDTDNIIAKF